MATSSSGTTLQPASAIDFLDLLHNLKTTKRTGWVLKNVDKPESIADHMYRMSMMALIAGDCGVDSNRCIRLAIVHDVAEALVGDITPHCGISKEEKGRMESEAMSKIREQLGSSIGKDVEGLWLEYEAGSTPEAQLVKDFDKVEMILQALEYERSQGIPLNEFFDAVEGKLKTEIGRSWALEIISRRALKTS